MTSPPVQHPYPVPRESEEHFRRAVLRIQAARDILKDDPRRDTPTPPPALRKN